MKKIISVLLITLLLSSCVYEESAFEQQEVQKDPVSLESEIIPEEPEIQEEPEQERISINCLGNFTCHENDLVFEVTLPEGWTFNGGTIDRDGNKVADCYMCCDETYEEWRGKIDSSAKEKEIGGKIFSVFSYEQGMLNYDERRPKEINVFEISEYKYHNGSHLYMFFLFENKDYGEEFTEEFEKMLETFEPAEGRDCGYIKKDGRISGVIHPAVPYSPEREESFEEEIVPFSMSVPEGWEPGTTETGGNIHSIHFEVPQNKNDTIFWIYKDSGTTYDDFLANHSLWVGIDEHTYHEVNGDFSKGSYIHFDYPAFEKYDHEEGDVPSYGRFYQLQFDGYVVVAHVYIRIDSEENTVFDEKICDEFISSIKILT